MKQQNCGSVPLEAQYLYRKGVEMIGQKRSDLAIVYLRQAVFVAPGFSRAYAELGRCLLDLGRIEEAASCYGKAARTAPPGATPGIRMNRAEAGALI